MRRMFFRKTVFSVCELVALIQVGLLLVIVAVVATPLQGDELSASSITTLENKLVQISVDRQTGKLLELADAATKLNRVGDTKKINGLWSLTVVVDDRDVLVNPAQAKSFRVRSSDNGQSLKLAWRNFEGAAIAELGVQVTICLDAETPVGRWQIEVAKPEPIGLRQVSFPRVFGLARQAGEHLAVPLWMGQQLSNPRSLLCPPGGRPRRWSWEYPGRLSAQCIAYWGNNGRGFYAACDDATVLRKSFAIQGTIDGAVNFEVIHYPENQAVGNSRWQLPYGVRLGTFQGDWVTAAERYRRWGTQQLWARQSRLRRRLVPEWVQQTGMWVWNRGRSSEVLPPAVAMRNQLGLPVNVLWHWWHGCAYDIGFPEYLPPREGTKSFQQAVSLAHKKGVRELIYMNQRCWGMSTRSWQEEHAADYAVKGRNGQIRPEVYNVFTGKALASMCMGTPFWRNKYASIAETAYSQLGIDGIYMDQACTALPCYDPSHGHPLGSGSFWITGFRKLVRDVRQQCHGDHPIVLAGEGCGEAWMADLDLMLTLQVSRERYASLNDPWDVIPFFPAIYHCYAITFGSYSSLTMPPYDELWPAEFAPKTPLALLDRKYASQFYLEQARAFVWGHQPTLANMSPELFRQRPDEMQFVMRIARTRHHAAKYLCNGQFVRAPKVICPERISEFSRLSIYAGQRDRLTSRSKRHPLAIAGAWRAEDNSVGIALASISETPVVCKLIVDRKYYRLPKHVRLFRIDEIGRHPISMSIQEDGTMVVHLPPLQTWVIELAPGD